MKEQTLEKYGLVGIIAIVIIAIFIALVNYTTEKKDSPELYYEPYYILENVQLKKIYLPKRVQEEIERVQLAKQEAKAKKEQIVANKALAQSKIELAKAEAQAIREKAKAEADRITIEAKAKATANLEIAKSLIKELIKELIEVKKIEAWKSGGARVPYYMGSSQGSFINIPSPKN